MCASDERIFDAEANISAKRVKQTQSVQNKRKAPPPFRSFPMTVYAKKRRTVRRLIDLLTGWYRKEDPNAL